MKCPVCGDLDSKVVDSRPSEDGSAIRRRRECIKCAHRFTTYEKQEKTPIMVVKKNDIREPFDKDKMMKGIIKACEKRPVSLERIELLVESIEHEIRNEMKKEVSTHYLGEKLMEKLKELDEVAYVRFASVYRQFKDVKSFTEELNKLLKNK
jgi:transcriptional repressor NrdR